MEMRTRQAHNALTQMQRDTVVQLVLRGADEEGIPNPRFSFTEDSDAAPVRNFVPPPSSLLEDVSI